MPEAVIVSTARSPIGRAFKGSLKDERPDDLAAAMVTAALAGIPAFDAAAGPGRGLDDIYLGCAEPSGEAGSNMARVVSILAGLDNVPAATINRFCASSLQTLRMAFHAIKAGEGQAFVAAGVEAVSRYRDWAGAGETDASTHNPRFEAARKRTEARAAVQHAVDRPAAGRPDAGRVHRHGPDGGERRHKLRHHPCGAGRLGGAQPEPGRGGHRFRVLRPRNHALYPRRRLGGGPRRFTAARRHSRGGRRPAAGFPQRRHRDGRERVPAQRRGRRRRGHE